MTCNIIVCISGNGSNLQAIIDAKLSAITICAVVSNKADAYGLTRAKNADIVTEVLLKKSFSSREQYDQALCACFKKYHPDLIILAGFMYILDVQTVSEFKNKIINIHPSLLPKYPGLNPYEQAIANQDKEHGSTVHYVTAELDAGPIIAQERIAIAPDDTPETLKQKNQALEHQLYPKVIARLAEQLCA